MDHSRFFANKWKQLLEEGDRPRALTGISQMEYSKFSELVLGADQKAAAEVAERIFAGEAIILKNALLKEKVDQIKKVAFDFAALNSASHNEIIPDCPDWHEINDTMETANGGYTVLDHSYYFFRGNEGNGELFNTADTYWELCKIFNGYAPGAFKTNLPADGLVDRIQLINYPRGGGHISTHTDPDFCIRALFGFHLSSSETDYDAGGFYIINGAGERVMLEDNMSCGDIVCWYSFIPHGVEFIDPDRPTNFQSHDGRWFMACNTIQSHLVKDRYRALPVG